MEAVKKRDSNIELFRIIAMLLIVAHHYVVNSGITQIIAEPPYTWHTYFLYLFGMWGKIGINCFVLITGYFMCTADISLRKFLRLLLEIWFYNIVIYAAFVISGYEPVSFSGIYAALLPKATHDAPRDLPVVLCGTGSSAAILLPFQLCGMVLYSAHNSFIYPVLRTQTDQ